MAEIDLIQHQNFDPHSDSGEKADLRLGGKYSARRYQHLLQAEFVSRLTTLESWRTLLALALGWIAVAALAALGGALGPAHFRFWIFYLPLGFLIAGRQSVMLQIVHEASHQLISGNRKLNHFVGEWLAAVPVGLSLEGYTAGHMRHHAYTNTPNDLPTDLEKHEAVDFSDSLTYRKFAQDLFGITAFRSSFGHMMRAKGGKWRQSQANGEEQKGAKKSKALHFLTQEILVQSVILAVIFHFRIVNYFLLWVIPLLSFNMVLLRVRGIAEHGLPRQLGVEILRADQGNKYTRSVVPERRHPLALLLQGVERVLIGSLACNYHHEHHLVPNVPFYNLRSLHERVGPSVRAACPYVYVGSYLLALRRGRDSGGASQSAGS